MKNVESNIRCPIAIRISSIIWILVGALMFAITIFAASFIDIEIIMEISKLGVIFVAVYGLFWLLSIYIIYSGIQVFRGKTIHILGNGIGAILISGGWIYHTLTNNSDVGSLFIGVIFMLSGILAVVFYKEYAIYVNSIGR